MLKSVTLKKYWQWQILLSGDNHTTWSTVQSLVPSSSPSKDLINYCNTSIDNIDCGSCNSTALKAKAWLRSIIVNVQSSLTWFCGSSSEKFHVKRARLFDFVCGHFGLLVCCFLDSTFNGMDECAQIKSHNSFSGYWTLEEYIWQHDYWYWYQQFQDPWSKNLCKAWRAQLVDVILRCDDALVVVCSHCFQFS